MASIVITPLVETWEIANLTNSNSIWFADVPGLNTSGSIPRMVGGVPQWFDALEITSSDILGASDNFRNSLIQNPPLVGSRGYKHTHEGLYDTVMAGVPLPDATTWHSHSGLDILTAGIASDADLLHTHDSFITDAEVNVLISSAVAAIDFDDYVRQDGSITQLSDITSDGGTIEAAVSQAHAQGHTLLEHLDDDPVTMDNLIKLFDGSNADCCHTHSNLGGGTFDGEHNELDGLQGGIIDEYYHLTEEENNLVSRLGEDSAGLTFDGESIGGGVSVHNSLVGIQGGETDEHYHLDYDQYLGLIGGPSFYADDLHNHDFPHSADEMPLGTPTDGDWDDGLIVGWDEDTPTSDAIDELNETMSYLAPEDAGSMDGDTLTTSGVSTYTGRLSANNINYHGSFPAGSTYTRIIKDGTFNILSPSQSDTFNKADEGILRYYINGAQNDTYDLASAFVEGLRSDVGGQIYPPATGGAGNLRIDSVIWYNDFPKWQIGNATMFVVPGDLRQGYNYFDLKHDLDTDQDTSTLEFFYDNDAGSNPTVNTPTVTENTLSIREISGVKMYDRTSTFDVDVIGSDCFNNVFHATYILRFTATNSTVTAVNMDYDDVTVSGLSDPPVIGETMTVTNKTLVVPNSNVRSINARFSVVPYDPYGSYSAGTSVSVNRLIDAYGTTSTTLNEYFDDENRRLPAGAYDSVPGAITGQWTSTNDLSNGMAQVYNGALWYPTIDFTTGYLPTGQTADYDEFSGDQVYYRAFYDNGNPHSSGQLELSNLTSSDVGAIGNGNVNVEIKLPTVTGWLDLGSPFDSGAYSGSDGDGCRTSQSGDDWFWTSSTDSTADSGWMIIVRVTFRNATDDITQIRERGW